MSHYDKGLYEKYLNEAKESLNDVIKKYAILGTYTTEVYDAQYRYNSLCMNTATIFVGGDSDLSRDMLRDAVDDAIRAAESAYRFGYINGCNVTLSRIILDMMKESDGLEYEILSILREAFRQVYFRVLQNAYPDREESELYEIIENSLDSNMVYDLNKEEYSHDIINSTKTDVEVLTAAMDLLKLLLVGNQVILSNYLHKVD